MTEETFKQQLLDELATALHNQPDALRWLFAYFRYAHYIDDLVDEPKDEEAIRKTFALAEAMFASDFWRQHGPYLYPVLRTVHFDYFISAEWERSDEEWKRRHADLLRHCGNSVAVAVLALFCDDEQVMRTAKRLKEFSHTYHHDYQCEGTTFSERNGIMVGHCGTPITPQFVKDAS